jgi:hypothetical protein
VSKKANLTLGEVMGKKGENAHSRGIDLKDLPDLLGEGMPHLEFHALGRVRLMRALRQRFGDNYRNVPGIQSVIKKFDDETKIEMQHHLLRKKFGRK